MAAAQTGRRITAPNLYRDRLRADRSSGWRMRRRNTQTMHYFFATPDGSLSPACSQHFNVWSWYYRADVTHWMAYQRRPCATCLKRAPVPPPAGAGSKPRAPQPWRRTAKGRST